MKRRFFSVYPILLLSSVFSTGKGTVISKSSKEECVLENDVENKNKTVCRSKLVVSITVNANEVTASYLDTNSRPANVTSSRENHNILKLMFRESWT